MIIGTEPQRATFSPKEDILHQGKVVPEAAESEGSTTGEGFHVLQDACKNRSVVVLANLSLDGSIFHSTSHLEERLLDQAQARASYNPPLLGESFA